ncbi:hypothetical protein BDY17DRAFT_288553 [Neohortaea acidophila]|uniref:Uncharacterized protein n=1 Tax=Neohortaea acidophila TaxID=245834 RepID=A0A6A6Q5A8_9PEZI|nr:uncharacterized protein BDY17DRAFT_288553 [Neohortaea acidophila]KAF2487229.1 hypothetical protein BDY17DRAFT_288553 [Neohortaea acidophila]
MPCFAGTSVHSALHSVIHPSIPPPLPLAKQTNISPHPSPSSGQPDAVISPPHLNPPRAVGATKLGLPGNVPAHCFRLARARRALQLQRGGVAQARPPSPQRCACSPPAINHTMRARVMIIIVRPPAQIDFFCLLLTEPRNLPRSRR